MRFVGEKFGRFVEELVLRGEFGSLWKGGGGGDLLMMGFESGVGVGVALGEGSGTGMSRV